MSIKGSLKNRIRKDFNVASKIDSLLHVFRLKNMDNYVVKLADPASNTISTAM